MLELKPNAMPRAIDRPVPLRMRQDIEASPRYVRGQLCFIVKDPVTLSHHRLWAEEFSLLEMLDGQTSLAQMKHKFEQLYPAARLDLSRLDRLLGIFFRNGLVLSDRPGQATPLLDRHDQWRRQQRQSLTNFLAIRLPGFNPDRLLQALNHRLGWMLSPPMLIICGLGMLASWLFMLYHFQDSPTDLPGLQAYLTPSNLVWLVLVVCCLKVLHEFGHGLACVHYGAQCHEMGVMLLAFVPTLYCDVSDAWTISSRWQRAFIAAAGMWFEMLAATICAWLWWASHPGVVHSICFNAMVVGSVSTLAINGNPLLRYDGYFILSDTLDLPNLWREARSTLMRGLDRVFFVKPTLARGDAPHMLPGFMSMYAVLSIAYQAFVFACLLAIMYLFLRNARLELVGLLLVGMVSVGTLSKPVRGGAKLAFSAEQRQNIRWTPAIALVTALFSAVVLAWIPFSYSLRVPVLFQMNQYAPVTIVVPGNLVDVLPEGTSVTQGQAIAHLVSPQLELELVARQGELSRQSSKLFTLQSKRADDPSVTNQITAVQESIRGLSAEVDRLKAAKEQLIIRAPVDGVILAPVHRPLVSSDWESPEELRWTGTPLDSANLGCFLAPSESLCSLGNPHSWQAIAFLNQSQAELLQPSGAVSVKSALAVDLTWEGAVSHVTTQALSKLPNEIVQSNLIPLLASTTQAHAQSPEPIYVATLDIETTGAAWMISDSCFPLHNSIGFAKIKVAPQSMAYRLWRFLDATFAVELLGD